jgi:AcrR family transcriptional regulator
VVARKRRSAEDAKAEILAAAERRLIEGGPDAVRVQLVAADVGLTDAAVHHHFGNRQGLLEALLRHAGREVRREMEARVATWNESGGDIADLSVTIAEYYERRGYARLALWLSLQGTPNRGSGMLSALNDTFQATREQRAANAGEAAPDREDTARLVALFHMIQVAEPLFGDAMRRSAGLGANRSERERFRAWTAELFDSLLGSRSDS